MSHTHIKNIVTTTLFALLILLTACATQYEADADADQLVAAMQNLPEVKPYHAKVYFYPEVRSKNGKAEANSADQRNLNKIIFPEDEMLNLAGHGKHISLVSRRWKACRYTTTEYTCSNLQIGSFNSCR